MSINYSIIIPHKNSLSLLKRCVNSIPTRKDIEVLVIDDDSSIQKEEWDLFKKNNQHITDLILTKEGKGAGYARNIGLTKANGKWIVFADADDFFYPNAFECLDSYKDSDYDIIYFYCNSRNGNTLELIPDRVKKIKRGIKTRDYNLLRYGSSVPWGKMIRRTLILNHNIWFDETFVSNDVMFSLKVGYYAKRIGTISSPLYCCTENMNSLFFKRDNERMKTRVLVAARANIFLHKHQLDDYQLRTIINYIFYFFPNNPKLFLWALWKGRYKGHFFKYIYHIGRSFISHILSRNK